LGDYGVLRRQVDVEGYQDGTRANDGGSRGRVSGEVADVGRAAVESATADSFEALATRGFGGGFVEVDRDSEAGPDFCAGAVGDFHAVVERCAGKRDEGDYIGRADARVNAAMDGEIDELGSFPRSANGGFGDGWRRAREGDHTTVVIGVRFPAENQDLRNARDGVDDRFDFQLVAAFGKIGDAFDHAVRS
jgi:hypothetical protein